VIKEMANLDKLFSTVKIGTMELKNRVAMGEIASGGREGYISQKTTEFYVERARGGAGLIMVGGVAPNISGVIGKYHARVDDDKYIPRLAELADLIHGASSEVKAGVQLLHVGRQVSAFSAQAIPAIKRVAPSPIKWRGIIAHGLTTEETEYLVREFVKAARRIKEAGFDCVSLHGAHGYLISQFISPFSNKRTDKYGGSIQNRARFACEIIHGIKQECGNDFPVLIKINAEDYMKTEEGIAVALNRPVAPLLVEAGVDEIHITSGSPESYTSAIIPSTGAYMIPRGVYADFAAEIRKVVNIPVGAINRINDPVVAEQILQDKKADVIWMTRALIADPKLPSKSAEGKFDEIRTCIACNTCIDMARQGWGQDEWKCAINPAAHREGFFRIIQTLRPKRVLVIGGGPAGMEAARVGALVGHDITLWEKGDKLGGQLILASIPPNKEGFNHLTHYFTTQLNKLGVKVELNKDVTPALIKEMKPNAVVIATGSTPLIPPIPGVNGDNVVTARDILVSKAEVGGKVVVVGGGEVGMETAQFLIGKANKVTLVEMLPELGADMVRDVFNYVHSQLAQHDMDMLTDTEVEEITDSGVVVSGQNQRRWVIEADTVVLATGAKSNRSLYETLEGLESEIYLAGDCLYPGNIKSAIYHGAVVAHMLD